MEISLTDFVRITIDDKFQSAKDELVTKDFLRAELSGLSERLSKEIQKSKVDMIKWFLGSIFVTIVLMFISLYLKK